MSSGLVMSPLMHLVEIVYERDVLERSGLLLGLRDEHAIGSALALRDAPDGLRLAHLERVRAGYSRGVCIPRQRREPDHRALAIGWHSVCSLA